jgi:hypothetical protein
MHINNMNLFLGALIIVLSLALSRSISKRPKTDKLKRYISELSEKHLEVTRKDPQPPIYPQPQYLNQYETYIPYQHGLDGPLKFYAPVEKQYNNKWQKVGVIMSVSITDDTIYNIEQRAVFPFNDDNYEYRAHDTDKNVYINIPSVSGRKIVNGDKFLIPGKETIGEFELARDTDYYMIPL